MLIQRLIALSFFLVYIYAISKFSYSKIRCKDTPEYKYKYIMLHNQCNEACNNAMKLAIYL